MKKTDRKGARAIGAILIFGFLGFYVVSSLQESQAVDITYTADPVLARFQEEYERTETEEQEEARQEQEHRENKEQKRVDKIRIGAAINAYKEILCEEGQNEFCKKQ